MAFSDLIPLLPPVPDGITMAEDWPHAENAILDILKL